MPVRRLVCPLFACLLLLSLSSPVVGQQKKRIHHFHHKVDTSLIEINTRISDSILEEAEIKDTTVPNMVNKVESYSFTLNRSEGFLTRRLDTAGILAAVSGLERSLNFFKNRLEKNDDPLNLRNLNTAAIMLNEHAERLHGWEDQLTQYGQQMNLNLTSLNKISHDTTLNNPSLDSTLHGQLTSVHERAGSLDSLQHLALVKIKTLRNRVSINSLLVQDLITEIRYRTQTLRANMLKEEEPPLFSACSSDYDASFAEIVVDAMGRSYRVITIFMQATWDNRLVNILIWLLLLTWFLITLHHLRKAKENKDIFEHVSFIKKSALVSSLLLLFTYGPFLYASAPMSYLHLNELFRLIALSILLIPYLTKKARWAWLLLCFLWIYFALDDLLLDAALGERWFLMIGGLLLLGTCLFLYRKKTIIFSGLDLSPATGLVLILTMVQITLSIIANLAGRLTLSKLFAISSIQGLVLAVTLKVFSAILIDAIYIQSEAFRNNRFSAFLNFIDLKDKLRRLLWILAVMAWVFSLLRNLTLYDQFYYVLDYFFSKKRAIGSISFSYSNLVIFLLIIWISSLLSRFVNFFFDQNRATGSTKRSKLGSITLIIRIGIWTAGFLIAIAAAGIPIDKISILLGALGVGIGFGLQNLVNNLVSGIILAFERPIQIGDLIEIGGRTGVVQEIGVRSSKIDNGEGANIIVPNGDMLSQQLINWTLNGRNRRSHLAISVPFKSDFKKAKDLIGEVIQQNDRIMKDPAPEVIVNAFANNAVSFEILYWLADFSEVQSLNNQLLLEIAESFSKNGIAMD
jgi:potassium-dependent mechanosensitive channel